MRRVNIAVASIALCALTVIAKTKEEKQAEARKKADATLERLYQAKPSAEHGQSGVVIGKIIATFWSSR